MHSGLSNYIISCSTAKYFIANFFGSLQNLLFGFFGFILFLACGSLIVNYASGHKAEFDKHMDKCAGNAQCEEMIKKSTEKVAVCIQGGFAVGSLSILTAFLFLADTIFGFFSYFGLAGLKG